MKSKYMIIGKTELKHWQNGIQRRGKNHVSIALSFFGIGILICNNPSMDIFILTK